MAEVTYQVELITPEMAKALLENQAGNRPISPLIVATYADAMRRGLWKLTNQGIAISILGQMIDGQHRMAAVIEAGIPVLMMVARNVLPESRDAIDAGRAQRPSDRLTASGIKNAAHKCAIVAMALFQMGFRRQRMDTADHREVIAAIDDDLEVVVAHNANNTLSAPTRAALFIAWTQGPAGAAFAKQVLTGEGLINGMPAYVLRERLFRAKTTRAVKDTRKQEFDRTLFCARAHIEGRQLFTSNKLSAEARVFFEAKFKAYLVGKGIDVSDARATSYVHRTVADMIEERRAAGKRKS